ncbi:(p)ppGpp synthetase I, SpoT/RelA [Ferrimonas sediminum]|uniref:GTP pyrophosphokinase n=1 Tax=Ferrimonas sediminum TaxID=718193 RepID=A0A1G8PP21_9GAMM|nr:GTP diphosphokinase [Ferrimonas sediminum]SDI93590.1 (p)ppGpp synthetase I, SpoT/RelA [Ferrimonas sediminum]
MVSVRQIHFGEQQVDLQQWLQQLALSDSQQQQLEATYRYCQNLTDVDTKVVDACLIRAREMVEILLPLNMDIDTLEASLLFTCIDEQVLTLEQVEAEFGERLLPLIKSVQVMDAIRTLQTGTGISASEGQIDNLRRMLLAMVEDVRAVVIKLAEGVVMLREVKNADEETRVVLAREVRDIYAPLANRLGIGQLKWELEDLSFRYLHPDTYKEIAKLLDEKRIDRQNYIEEFVSGLQQQLDADGIRAEVYGRPKHIYSIWKKMQKKNLAFSELFDVRAVRIIAERLQDCYAALGVVHTQWRHLPNEFDDYVATPKPNGYQSIHTVVLGPEAKSVEIQIRTEQMHQDAELGVAAHWKYKEGPQSGKSSGFEEKINWLRKILQWQEDVVESGNLVDEVRSQVFEDRVYVFTPRGDVVDLPAGSTVLDFAYYIHSVVGHRCIGAKIDGRIVPFTTIVETGQRVEIITAKQPNPKRDWLNPSLGYIKTSRARAKIAHFFKLEDKDKNAAAGKEMMETELQRHGLKLEDANSAVQRFNMHALEDLLAAIGGGDIRLNQVINHIQSRHKREQDSDEEALAELVSRPPTKPRQSSGQIEVNGVGNLMTHMAKCCQPLPGDPIYGYITQGRGVSVHREECEQLAGLLGKHPERGVEVVWGESVSGGYTVSIRVIANDRSGLLRDVTTLLANEKSNVLEMRSHSDARQHTAAIELKLELFNMDSLTRLVSRLSQIPGVLEVGRL